MLNDDQIKRYGTFAFIAFGMVLTLFMCISYFTFTPQSIRGPGAGEFNVTTFSAFWSGIKGAFLGLLAGAGTFFVGWKMNL